MLTGKTNQQNLQPLNLCLALKGEFFSGCRQMQMFGSGQEIISKLLLSTIAELLQKWDCW